MATPLGIVGYTYKADVYCPECALAEALRDRGLEGHGLSYVPQEAIDLMGRFAFGSDVYYSDGYDSDDFPKPVFQGGDVETCCKCGGSF